MKLQTFALVLVACAGLATLIPAAQSSGNGGTPPPSPPPSPVGHNWTSGTVEAADTGETIPGDIYVHHEDVDGNDGSTTWKRCSGDDDHEAHTEITTSKSTNKITGHGYTLFMKSKSKITATGDNTTVHFNSGTSNSTFEGTGDNNQGWLHGTSNSITWNGNNNNTGNNP